MTVGESRPAIRAVAIAAAAVVGTCNSTAADTLLGALAQSYLGNPQVNSQRAILRQVDEGVPKALAGYRPQVNANAQAGNQFTWTRTGPITTRDYTSPRSVGVTATQTLFNGFQTANQTRSAESQVF